MIRKNSIFLLPCQNNLTWNRNLISQMRLKILTLCKCVDTVLFGNHGLSLAVESVTLLFHPYMGRISHYLSEIYESSTCNVHLVSCMCRMQLLKEVSCDFRRQYTNMWKVFEQQVSFWTAEDKYLQLPYSETVVHKLYGMGSETRLNFLKWHLGYQIK